MKARTAIVSLILLTLWASPALARTYTVSMGLGGDFRTVQQCIETASDGDTCQVAPGLYMEEISFFGRGNFAGYREDVLSIST